MSLFLKQATTHHHHLCGQVLQLSNHLMPSVCRAPPSRVSAQVLVRLALVCNGTSRRMIHKVSVHLCLLHLLGFMSRVDPLGILLLGPSRITYRIKEAGRGSPWKSSAGLLLRRYNIPGSGRCLLRVLIRGQAPESAMGCTPVILALGRSRGSRIRSSRPSSAT